MALKRTVTIERDQRPHRRMRMTPMYRNPKVETRYKNTSVLHAGTNESNTLVNGIAAGDGTENRSGRKALCKSFQVRLTGPPGLPSGSQSPIWRVVLYSPKVGGTLLTGLTGNSLAGPIENDKYWVMYDRLHTTQFDYSGEGGRPVVNLNIRKLLTTEFSGTGGSDITRGDVYLYVATEGEASFVVGHTKVWFQDK